MVLDREETGGILLGRLEPLAGNPENGDEYGRGESEEDSHHRPLVHLFSTPYLLPTPSLVLLLSLVAPSGTFL